MKEQENTIAPIVETTGDEQQQELAKRQKKRRRKIARIIVLAVLVAAVIIYFAVPAVKSSINQIFTVFSSASVDTIMGYIRSFGVWAVVISFLLMMFQSLIAPLPAFLLTFANAAVFGWWQGAILSWTSSMAGAALCFFIARVLGRDAVEKITGKGVIKTVDVFFERYGKNTILICRLLPFVSFDFISYAAGLTGMGFWGFFVATGIGQLPATIVYSYVGGMLTGSTKTFVYALMIIFGLAALVFLIKKVYNDKHRNKNVSEQTTASGEVLAEAGDASPQHATTVMAATVDKKETTETANKID